MPPICIFILQIQSDLSIPLEPTGWSWPRADLSRSDLDRALKALNSQRTPTSPHQPSMAPSSSRWDRPGKHSCISFSEHLSRNLMTPLKIKSGNEGRRWPKYSSSHRKLPVGAGWGRRGRGQVRNLSRLAARVLVLRQLLHRRYLLFTPHPAAG